MVRETKTKKLAEIEATLAQTYDSHVFSYHFQAVVEYVCYSHLATGASLIGAAGHSAQGPWIGICNICLLYCTLYISFLLSTVRYLLDNIIRWLCISNGLLCFNFNNQSSYWLSITDFIINTYYIVVEFTIKILIKFPNCLSVCELHN